MNFIPRTEKEIAERKLMAKGIYDFEIVDAIEKDSKSSGNRMIELRVRLSNGDVSGRVITDYLLAETPEKLRRASEACGLLDKYNTGSLSHTDFQGKRGKLKLGVEKGKNGYAPKNVVLVYLGPAPLPMLGKR